LGPLRSFGLLLLTPLFELQPSNPLRLELLRSSFFSIPPATIPAFRDLYPPPNTLRSFPARDRDPRLTTHAYPPTFGSLVLDARPSRDPTRTREPPRSLPKHSFNYRSIGLATLPDLPLDRRGRIPSRDGTQLPGILGRCD
jgi:hypothetical protein